MKDHSRRKFLKKSALTTATVGAFAVSARGNTPEEKDAGYPEVLYRETEQWKRYYETLK